MKPQSTPGVTDGLETPNGGSLHPACCAASSAFEATMEKMKRNDRRRAIALDLLIASDQINRKKAAEALQIARRLI